MHVSQRPEDGAEAASSTQDSKPDAADTNRRMEELFRENIQLKSQLVRRIVVLLYGSILDAHK